MSQYSSEKLQTLHDAIANQEKGEGELRAENADLRKWLKQNQICESEETPGATQEQLDSE